MKSNIKVICTRNYNERSDITSDWGHTPGNK